MGVEHRDKRYEDSSHPAGGQGKALSPKRQLGKLQSLETWRNPADCQKRIQCNIRMILTAVIEKPPSNSDSTCEGFTLAQISNQIVLIVR